MNKAFLNFLDSQKLFRLGIKSKSGFHYNRKSKDLHWEKDLFLGMGNFDNIYVPAYTDHDLNEILPEKIFIDRKNINADRYDLAIRKTRHSKWVCEYESTDKNSNASYAQQKADSEVESKAKMIFFLITKKILQ